MQISATNLQFGASAYQYRKAFHALKDAQNGIYKGIGGLSPASQDAVIKAREAHVENLQTRFQKIQQRISRKPGFLPSFAADIASDLRRARLQFKAFLRNTIAPSPKPTTNGGPDTLPFPAANKGIKLNKAA